MCSTFGPTHQQTEGTTRLIDGQVVYTLNIQPDAPGGQIGCGAPGRAATFTIDGQPINPRVMWNNDVVWNVPLRRGYEVYLPLIRKG